MIKNIFDSVAVELAVDTLLSEGLVIMPCDTIYGILGIYPETEARITSLKGRSPDKPYIRLLADTDALARVSATMIPDSILDMLPAPLTLIVLDTLGTKTAVRIPEDDRLLNILRRVGRQVFSTSVNTSGSPAMWQISEITDAFEDKVDLILDGGDLPGAIPSTILDMTARPRTVLRQGSFIVSKSILND